MGEERREEREEGARRERIESPRCWEQTVGIIVDTTVNIRWMPLIFISNRTMSYNGYKRRPRRSGRETRAASLLIHGFPESHQFPAASASALREAAALSLPAF